MTFNLRNSTRISIYDGVYLRNREGGKQYLVVSDTEKNVCIFLAYGEEGVSPCVYESVEGGAVITAKQNEIERTVEGDIITFGKATCTFALTGRWEALVKSVKIIGNHATSVGSVYDLINNHTYRVFLRDVVVKGDGRVTTKSDVSDTLLRRILNSDDYHLYEGKDAERRRKRDNIGATDADINADSTHKMYWCDIIIGDRNTNANAYWTCE